jgi:hypothetical protein
MATRSTWDSCDSRTIASRYHRRLRPSPHGVNSTESRWPSGLATAQSTKRASAARSARSCSGLSRRLANGQYGQS